MDGQTTSPSITQKDVLVVMSTSTICSGLRASTRSTYCILTLRMQSKVPGPDSLTALKLMLMSGCKDKSVICMRRLMKRRMLFMMQRSRQEMQRQHSPRSTAMSKTLSKSSRILRAVCRPPQIPQRCHQQPWQQLSQHHR